MRQNVKYAAVTAVVGAVMLATMVRSQDATVIQAASPRPGELVCQLDRPSVTPGELVRLTEFIRADHPTTVGAVSHRFARLADCDPKTGLLQNRKSNQFWPSLLGQNDVMRDLPHDLTTPGVIGGLLWKVETPRVKGLEFEFRPQQLGAYLIYAKWVFAGGDEEVESLPVILTVRPPLDRQGKPIVRPEWLPRE